MFPFSFSKTIEVPIKGNNMETASKMIIRTLEGYIRAVKPNSISSTEHQITFSDSVPQYRFILSWNPLMTIDRGVVEVVPKDHRLLISYKLWFTGLFISASLLAVTFGVCIFSSGFTLVNLAITLGIWLCYFGFNIVKTIVGFEGLVRSAVEI